MAGGGALMLKPTGEVMLTLAGGEQAACKVGKAFFQIAGGSGTADLAAGPEGEPCRLSIRTLEACGLDPGRFRLE